MEKKWTIVLILMIMHGRAVNGQVIRVVDSFVDVKFNAANFKAVHFDSSFFKAMFLEKTDKGHVMKILSFDYSPLQQYSVNIPENFLWLGLLNTGNVIVGAKSEVDLININDGYSSVMLTDPTQFFKDKAVTNITAFNDFNQTVLFVYNNNQLAEIDSRLPMLSTVNQINLSGLQAGYKIVDMSYISNGKQIGVLVKDTNFERVLIVDQASKSQVRLMGNEVDDCVRLSYNMEMNMMVLVKSSTKLIMGYRCSDFSNSVVINFSLNDLDDSLIKNVYAPLGTNVFLVTTDTQAFFYDLNKQEFIGKVTFPGSSKEIYWAEGTNFFMSRELDSTNTVIFRLFKVESSDSRLCHKSCGTKCKEIFRPCFNAWWILLAMFSGIAAILIFVLFVAQIMRCFAENNKSNEIVDVEGNEYEITQDGEVRQKRISIGVPDDFEAPL